jgi:hypothetical protein
MSKTKGVFKVYFDSNGDLLHRLYYWQQQQGNYKEEDNHVFTDQLEYTGYFGSHISFKSVMTGRKYHMFLSDFDAMMKAKKMRDNLIEGEFTFTKKGRVQGFKMILPPKP